MRLIKDHDVDEKDYWSYFMDFVREECISWSDFFEFAKPEIMEIARELKDENFYPTTQNIFNAFKFTSFNNIKIVLIGQDPYANTFRHSNGKMYPNAMGLSFSVDDEAPIPASLRTIFRELVSSGVIENEPKSGNLINWALQGVFLYNTTLTVRQRESNSHKTIWNKFTKKVILILNKKYPKCVYFLWGKHAQSYKDIISKSAIIFECCHPSPMATNKIQNGNFIGCNHFKLANEELVKKGLKEINWDPGYDGFEYVEHEIVDMKTYIKDPLPKIYLVNKKNNEIKFNGTSYAIKFEGEYELPQC